jgi:hypothetical protein
MLTEMAQVVWTLKLQIHLGFKFRNIYVNMYTSESTNMYRFYLLFKILTSYFLAISNIIQEHLLLDDENCCVRGRKECDEKLSTCGKYIVRITAKLTEFIYILPFWF